MSHITSKGESVEMGRKCFEWNNCIKFDVGYDYIGNQCIYEYL